MPVWTEVSARVYWYQLVRGYSSRFEAISDGDRLIRQMLAVVRGGWEVRLNSRRRPAGSHSQTRWECHPTGTAAGQRRLSDRM